ncbi:endothelial zinc finger protein induced by tumor necrosis factor alpha-like isoform X2 [Thalassophryne amazonica]|nr:endothelial zinc finger protein induced by tumor necrosis factor alpha-like isoform X2 [Thalassophryne amazonica]
MQSLTQTSSGPNAMTDTEAEPVQSQTHTEEVVKNMTAPSEVVIASQATEAGLQSAEAQAAAVTEPASESLIETSLNNGLEKPSRPAALLPSKNKNSCVLKVKKQDKGVRDGKKYIPSKKAMIDPLKMDMSKPPVVPLTSSQLSLQCIECHIIFSDHKSKERHLKLSHPAEYEQCILRNALFACYVCDRHFTNSTELMAHQKTHIEKKPFKCPICAQAFKKTSELTLHKKVHYGQGGYACADCGKPCKTLTLLKYHHRTHTGERPYVCRECGKRFSMSKALQKHIESHGPEGAEGQVQDSSATANAQLKKNDGASTVNIPVLYAKPSSSLQKHVYVT